MKIYKDETPLTIKQGIDYVEKGYITTGYKGKSPIDVGFFYCPYVPLQIVRVKETIKEAYDRLSSFRPKINFKTRYGMTANPFKVGP